MGIGGLAVAGFITGGALKGAGEGIQKEAEENRQAALLYYKLGAEASLKREEIAGKLAGDQIGASARTTAAATSAGAHVEGSKIAAKATTDAAGIRAGAETASANIRTAKFVVQDDGTGGYAKPDGSFVPTVNPDGTPIKTKDKTDKLPAIPATIEYLMKPHGDQAGMSFQDAFDAATAAKSNPTAKARVLASLQAAILANDTGPSKDAKGASIDKVAVARKKAIESFNAFTGDGEDDAAAPATPPPAKAPGILTPPPPAPAAVQPGAPAMPAPMPSPGATPATGPGGQPATTYRPGQTIYIKGVPHVVQPDGRTALPVGGVTKLPGQ